MDLFKSVASASPASSAVINEHLSDNGELLPHPLMSDLLRYAGKKLISHDPEEGAEVRNILGILEAAFTSGNSETENAIAVSFIENIETESFFGLLEPLLGAAMAAEHRRQMAWQNAR